VNIQKKSIFRIKTVKIFTFILISQTQIENITRKVHLQNNLAVNKLSIELFNTKEVWLNITTIFKPKDSSLFVMRNVSFNNKLL